MLARGPDNHGSGVQNLDFDLLTSRALEPVFWTSERLGRVSAWWGHVPFAFWLVANSEPRLLVELGTHYGVSYAAFCEAVLRPRLATRCYAVDTWAGDPHAGAYGEDVYAELKEFHDRRYASFSQLVRRTFDDARADFAGDHANITDLRSSLCAADDGRDDPLLHSVWR